MTHSELDLLVLGDERGTSEEVGAEAIESQSIILGIRHAIFDNLTIKMLNLHDRMKCQ